MMINLPSEQLNKIEDCHKPFAVVIWLIISINCTALALSAGITVYSSWNAKQN